MDKFSLVLIQSAELRGSDLFFDIQIGYPKPRDPGIYKHRCSPQAVRAKGTWSSVTSVVDRPSGLASARWDSGMCLLLGQTGTFKFNSQSYLHILHARGY